jgi:peptidoglycan/xylan/chitin deacetylase (PgdA/CDA1 family)
MKVIISHDVDHITAWEHWKDFLLPKFVVRNCIELSLGHISLAEFAGRVQNTAKNKWHNIEDLMNFDNKNDVPSTFFVAVANGRGLSYPMTAAKYWIERISEAGFDVGVHGIGYEDFGDIKAEFERFSQASRSKMPGIRIHYLMNNDNTLELLSKAGYCFDSTVFELKNPYLAGDMWEFPLHIMDGFVLSKGRPWQNQDLRQSKETSRRITDEAFNKGISYLTVLFHDRYFHKSFKTWKDWYEWFIDYLKGEKFEFISYAQAIRELERFNSSSGSMTIEDA